MVRIEKNPPVWTVILHRPEARNAVDRPTANALVEAFIEFERDADARVAVLWGDGGTFCAGADLKAIGTERGNRVDADGDGPMGPSRLLLSKPTIAAVAGHAVAGGLEDSRSGGLASRGGARGPRRVLSAVGRAAHRRRNRQTSEANRAVARARFHPDGSSCQRFRGAGHRPCESCGPRGSVASGSRGARAGDCFLPELLHAEQSVVGDGAWAPTCPRRCNGNSSLACSQSRRTSSAAASQPSRESRTSRFIRPLIPGLR